MLAHSQTIADNFYKAISCQCDNMPKNNNTDREIGQVKIRLIRQHCLTAFNNQVKRAAKKGVQLNPFNLTLT